MRTNKDKRSPTGFTTTVIAYDANGYRILSGSFMNIVSKLQSVLDDVPEEFRDKAEIDVSSYNEHGFVRLGVTITYKRPATHEEIDAYDVHWAAKCGSERQNLLGRLAGLDRAIQDG